jgi:hypothetical protein
VPRLPDSTLRVGLSAVIVSHDYRLGGDYLGEQPGTWHTRLPSGIAMAYTVTVWYRYHACVAAAGAFACIQGTLAQVLLIYLLLFTPVYTSLLHIEPAVRQGVTSRQ